LITFHQPPTQQEVEAFAVDWIQTLARRDYQGAAGMLRQHGQHYWTPELLQQHIEDTLTFYAASAVKIPTREALMATVVYKYYSVSSVANDTRVGHLHFSLFVDGNRVNEAISMWLEQGPEDFIFALEDIRVW
jgi:hypothetical protein